MEGRNGPTNARWLQGCGVRAYDCASPCSQPSEALTKPRRRDLTVFNTVKFQQIGRALSKEVSGHILFVCGSGFPNLPCALLSTDGSQQNGRLARRIAWSNRGMHGTCRMHVGAILPGATFRGRSAQGRGPRKTCAENGSSNVGRHGRVTCKVPFAKNILAYLGQAGFLCAIGRQVRNRSGPWG